MVAWTRRILSLVVARAERKAHLHHLGAPERDHVVDGLSVSLAAATHGYSRTSFHLVADSFAQAGMTGLLDERRERRGRRVPLELSPEVLEFITGTDPARSGAELAEAVARGSGCRCTGAPSNLPGVDEVVLAGGGGDAIRLRGLAGGGVGWRPGPYHGCRALRAATPGRRHHLARSRAGLRCRPGWRRWSALNSPRRSPPGGAGRRL